MLQIVIAVGIAALGVFVLWIAFSRTLRMYWGRRSTDLPFTPAQQKIGGLAWGGALIVFSATYIMKAFLPGSISQARWNHLSILLVTSAAATTWLLALLDFRTGVEARSSHPSRIVTYINWTFAAIFVVAAAVSLWLVLAGG